MSNIGKNIKKIRSVKKLSQTEFAELFSISRASIGSYEEGRADPKIDKIIEIANYFSIELSSLINKDLTVNEISKFKLTDSKMNSGSGNNLISQHKRKRIIYIDKDNTYNFIEHLANKSTWNGKDIELPPGLSNNTEIAFVHNDNAMNKNNEGIAMSDIVFAEFIELDDVFNNYTYIIITKDCIYLRKVESKKNTLLLSSVDKNFQPIIIEKSEIIAVFKINAVIKKSINHFIN